MLLVSHDFSYDSPYTYLCDDALVSNRGGKVGSYSFKKAKERGEVMTRTVLDSQLQALSEQLLQTL